jgi:transmembrane sensor
MKSRLPPSKSNRLIMEEASEWFVEFRVGDVDRRSREDFDEWLRRSPEHIRAYMQITKTYVALSALELSQEIDVDSLIAYANAGENVVPLSNSRGRQWNAPRSTAAEHELHAPGTPTAAGNAGRRRQILAAASGILGVVMAGGGWWWTEHFPSYTTDIGERRSLTLDDGSTVDLNARSRLRIEFTSKERRVELIDGQAFFQVAKDKTRPFIVSSGDATVRAVGTEFDVYRKANGTTVTVLEGRVAVYSNAHGAPAPESPPPSGAGPAPAPASPAATAVSSGSSRPLSASPAGLIDPSGAAAVFLSAGEQLTVAPAEVGLVSHHVDIDTATAWMQRRLIFDGSTLSDVVQEFNRYNRRQLVIKGSRLGDFHLSGVYTSSDPSSLIRFLRDQPGITVTEESNEIQIAPR